MRPYSAIFLCGDYNAHHVGWGCSCSSPRGTALFEASLARDLVTINDSRPTYVPDTGSTPSNIDLIFCPLSFDNLTNVEVISDPFGSDHLPVVLELSSSIAAVPRLSCRINIREVQWSKFHQEVEGRLPRLYESLWTGTGPSVIYNEFIRLVLEILLEQGTSRREGTTRRRRAQPLWWSEECDARIRERRGCYKAYYKEKTAERKAEFKRMDSEVKLFLRRQKRNSFRAFCESLDPSQGISRIWRTVRALASRSGALRTNVVTDADSVELRALRDDLVRADVPPVDIPLEEVGMVSVDIKGAFNSVLPVLLSDQLRRLSLPSRILNFISYMTSRRELSFSADGSGARSCGVGVPQGRVLSPILYNIYTSRLIEVLPPGVRYTMYAEDLFLYVRGRVISAARDLLAEALCMMIPWLRSLGFEISIAKCQFSVFTRSRGDLSDLVLPVEDHDLPCLGEIKYLGVVLPGLFIFV